MRYLDEGTGLGEMLFGAFYAERSEDKIAQAFYDDRNVSEALIEDVERALDRRGTVAAALVAGQLVRGSPRRSHAALAYQASER